MTFAQVVETSVTNNPSFQNYPHPDDYTDWVLVGMSLSNHTTTQVCAVVNKQVPSIISRKEPKFLSYCQENFLSTTLYLCFESSSTACNFPSSDRSKYKSISFL